MYRMLACLFLLFSINSVFSVTRQDVVLREETITPKLEKYDCHSNSLIELDNGSILAVWKGGFGEGKSNIDLNADTGIWQSHFDGTKWSEPQLIHFEKDSVVWNPVLAKLTNSELILFFRVGSDPRTSVSLIKRSTDQGMLWGEIEVLPSGIIGPAKNKPVLLEDGTLLCPSSIERGSVKDSYRATALWIDITKDGGKTWKKAGPLAIPGQPFGAIEPAFFFDQEGRLNLFCRDRALREGNKGGRIWHSVSNDYGLTWSKLEKTNLPNPDSAFDIADLGEGRLVLVYNNSETTRTPLSVAISFDGGKTWENQFDLETTTSEFPAAIATKDGLVHVIYAYEMENGQREIKHIVLNTNMLFGCTNQ